MSTSSRGRELTRASAVAGTADWSSVIREQRPAARAVTGPRPKATSPLSDRRPPGAPLDDKPELTAVVVHQPLQFFQQWTFEPLNALDDERRAARAKQPAGLLAQVVELAGRHLADERVEDGAVDVKASGLAGEADGSRSVRDSRQIQSSALARSSSPGYCLSLFSKASAMRPMSALERWKLPAMKTIP